MEMEFTCLACSKDFETEEMIKEHIIHYHKGKPMEVDSDDEIEVFTCDVCFKDFLSEANVIQHILCCHKSNPIKKMTKEEFQEMKLPKKMKAALKNFKVKKTLVLGD
jgi:hypothetical protein